MKFSLTFIFLLTFTFIYNTGLAQFDLAADADVASVSAPPQILPGDYQMNEYSGLLLDKNVALVINQTAVINDKLLPDTLISLGINIKKIFAPEHGYRGNSADGVTVKDYIDPVNKVKVVSLYGNKEKPSAEDLKGIDIVVFDIQDVGCRFYTFISTMTYVMQACAENKIPFIILDRPNPNGFYVDGPVLEPEYSSFIGLHPIPVVYGMTIGEYAMMVNGENWLENGLKADLTVIKCSNYAHSSIFELPVAPSPNLPNMTAVYLYPSLCLFEGTIVSVGRGTDRPFQQIGHPDFKEGKNSFIPKSIKGVSDNPPYAGIKCYGYDLSRSISRNKKDNGINLEYLIEFYEKLPKKEDFFTGYFNKLAGNSSLQEQIINGIDRESIRSSWAPELEKFKEIRRKYLIYEE